MEVVRTVGSVMGCIKMVVDLIDKNTERGVQLATALDFVKEDLDFIKVRLVGNKELHRQPLMQLKLQELAYDIDDFVHDLWIPGPFGGMVLSATGSDPRLVDIPRLNFFRDRAKTLFDELDKQSQSTKSDSSVTAAVSLTDLGSPSAGSSSYAPEKDLVGIAKPKMEIVDLLSPVDGSLRVISIAGRSGLGKTALARALYQDQDVLNKFDYKAWVVPSSNNSADILNKIHLEPACPSTAEALLQRFSNKILQVLHLAPASPDFRKNKRYLVFVDDVQRGTACKDIKGAFRENVMDSRIILTTSVPSIPWEFSSGSYVYIMQGLDKESSRELFRRKFRGEAGYLEEDKYRLVNKDVDVIVDKCDGLPMALISAAECLRGKEIIKLENTNFIKVSQELVDNIACSERDFELYKRRNENETTSVEMRRAIVEPYEGLLNNGEKDCLLYVSIFPSGYQINSKSLVRILIAEGLGPGDPLTTKDSEFVVSDIHDCLRMLMDQRMIEPVPIRSNCNTAKGCRVHSIMLQFTIKKAVSRNLVSLIHEGKSQRSTAGKVRRLSIQPGSNARCTGHPEKMDLSVLRSLAIFERGIVNFEKCKLVRVLNLESCRGLTPKDLDKICELLFLKYLSLRNTDIQELPKNVKKLQCLETLDTRDTVVIQLPVEVIMLPRLAYLFGQFELTNVTNVKKNRKQLTKFFSGNKSQLHTLGGIFVDVTQGLEIVLLAIQHATELKKVKVWYKDTPSSTGTATSTPVARDRYLVHTLKSTLEKRCTNLTDSSMELDSVSIDFNGVPNTFLDFLQTNGTISSIKVRKGSGSLPISFKLKMVSNLKKLHLFSTGIKSEELGALQHLKCLQYLKLAEHRHGLWDSVFHVQIGGFISLIWLCFDASNLKPPPLKIDKGVKIPLTSLLLLCKESHPRVQSISHLAKLNEVILHPYATDNEVTAWKEETKQHINRPYVEKKQQ